MGKIVSAKAWANNEVAYVAWDIDGKIDDCLGFDVTRIYLADDGSVARRADGSEDRVRCAVWVAFKGQSNPNWIPQDTGVWPVQKLSWRDLTLRKRRDGMQRRPDEVFVRYEIRPLGELKPGMEAVPSNGRELADVPKRTATGRIVKSHGKVVMVHGPAYEGKPRPLGYLGPAVATNDVKITKQRGPFRSTFTNGILSAQWLRNVLEKEGILKKKNALYEKICNPKDGIRKYLAGDVIPLISELLRRPGKFYLALYELEDVELEELLVKNANRIHVVLSNTGPGSTKSTKKKWDVRNSPARDKLVEADADVQHRMFNNSTHIGHNKFVVHVPPGGGPRSVLTGSTNWTATGLAGQSNNAILVEDDAVAGVFLDYWQRLKADELEEPDPLSKPMKDNQQSLELRQSNELAVHAVLANGASIDVWFSPNRPERRKPTSKTKPTPVPPDLAEVYRRMRMAKDAILFLAFYPGQSGKDCIVGEAIQIGLNDPSLLVMGAVSTAQAMPNYVGTKKDEEGEIVVEGESPSTYDNGNVSIVRAARIDDRRILGDFGAEQLTARGGIGAIIHDKLVVIDPRSPECSVILGSHNLGFKASYSNDENMLIVDGDRELAAAYAVHVLDVYDHYRFRAVETELQRKGKKGWSGFLSTDDHWQDGYVSGSKGAVMRYFAH
jgi:hypothetical protein